MNFSFVRIAASCQIHASNPLSATLEEKLGLPVRPKKPLTPFFQFLAENRTRLSKENPNLKLTELMQLCAKKYADVDLATKDKYKVQFLKENEEYMKKRSSYESKLTEEQKIEIAKAKEDAEDRKLKVEHKRVSLSMPFCILVSD
jgi:transcription factor A